MSAQANILALSLVGLVGLALASTYEPPSRAPALPPREDEESFAGYADQLIATSRMQAATLSPAGRVALAQALGDAANNIRSRSPAAAGRLDVEAASLLRMAPPSTGQELPPPPPPPPPPLEPEPLPRVTDPALRAQVQRTVDYLAGLSMGMEDVAGLITSLKDAIRSVGPTSPLLPGLLRLVRFVQNPELSPGFGSPL